MKAFDYHQHIHSDPGICGGEPVFRGTRVLLRIILAAIAHGDTFLEIQREYHTLHKAHYRAAIAFAAAAAAANMALPAPPFRGAY